MASSEIQETTGDFGRNIDRAVRDHDALPWASQRAQSKRPMRVLVCGSRDWTDRDAIASALTALPGEHYEIEVIHGNARGADSTAAQEAVKLGFAMRAFPADWQLHGRRAGILRNLAMLDEKPNIVLAFQRNGSRGTQHTIDEARKRGIPVEVHVEETTG